MILNQEFNMKADRQMVWDFFMDIESVAACMPGLEEVSQAGELSYQVRIKVTVGPIKARFGGLVTIVETEPPGRLKVTADWKDRITKSKAQVTAEVELVDLGDGLVRCQITTNVGIVGALGKFGHGVAQKKADAITAEFAACLRSRLEPQAAEL
jgi:hypothetical protein